MYSIQKKNESESVGKIAKRCNLNEEDSRIWFETVQFRKEFLLKKEDLEKTMDILQSSKIITNKIDLNELIFPNSLGINEKK